MTSPLMTKAVLLATTVSMAVTTLPATVSAQDYGPPPGQGYGQPPPDQNYGPPPNQQGYDQPPRGYGDGPPPDGDDQPPPPPPGYNGNGPPPPPPGYDASATEPDQRAQDQRYAQYAQEWEQQNCVKSHGNVGAGVVIGGLFGALVGAGVAGRGHAGGGALAGAAIGGVAGGAIEAGRDNETSPGCPPGYVVRGGAPGFDYDAGYAYAAPDWYHPWVWWGDRWVFRPYPYHAWYYHHYYRGGGGYRHHR